MSDKSGNALLLEAFERYSGRETLDLSYNHLGGKPDHFVAICEVLSFPMIKARFLDLRHNGLDRFAADRIANMISVNQCIERIDLRFNLIGTAGALSICSGLHVNRHIKECDLSGNLVDPSVMDRIYEYCRRNRLSGSGLAETPVPVQLTPPSRSFDESSDHVKRSLMRFDRKEKEHMLCEMGKLQNRLAVSRKNERLAEIRNHELLSTYSRTCRDHDRIIAEMLKKQDMEKSEHALYVNHLQARQVMESEQFQIERQQMEDNIQLWTSRCESIDMKSLIEKERTLAAMSYASIQHHHQQALQRITGLQSDLDVSERHQTQMSHELCRCKKQLELKTKQYEQCTRDLEESTKNENEGRRALSELQEKLYRVEGEVKYMVEGESLKKAQRIESDRALEEELTTLRVEMKKYAKKEYADKAIIRQYRQHNRYNLTKAMRQIDEIFNEEDSDFYT